MPAKKDAEYWRNYRARQKPEEAQTPRRTELARIEPEVIQAETGDRARGLPRSNYYGDWVPVIRSLSGRQVDAILSHPAIKTGKRER